jgi:hypothetical protein
MVRLAEHLRDRNSHRVQRHEIRSGACSEDDMATEGWYPKRGDHVRVRSTGVAATAMKFDGMRIRVHYDLAATSQTPDDVKGGVPTPVHRTSLHPPEWFELDELEAAE